MASSLQISEANALLNVLGEFWNRPAVILDLEGKVLACEQEAADPFQKSPDEMVGSCLLGEWLGFDPPACQQYLAEVQATGQCQLPPLRAGAGHIHVELRAAPRAGFLLALFQKPGASEDDEDPQIVRTRLREALQERDVAYRNLLSAYLRLQELDRHRTVFLGSAAHELKTPLSVIKGYLDLLLSRSLGPLTGRQTQILVESKDSCERLIRLVSMFLNYSALQSGRLALNLQTNDLAECMDELVARWQPAFARQQVRLETRWADTLPLFPFEWQKVQQVVGNLLDNALRHSPSGSKVVLELEPHFWERRAGDAPRQQERRQRHSQQPNSAHISVTDFGQGIAPEYHQEIFEEFVKLHGTSAMGMGLGLAIAKRLVQAHHGKIWVESEPGRGCSFSVVLPFRAE
jgi:signal transduction histidine kinase